MNAKKSQRWVVAAALLALGAYLSPQAVPANTWSAEQLTKALADSSRPQADRDRDADRKPAQLMTFLGVERGMTALDMIAGGGYLTEVFSVAVGADGKVLMQNPAGMGGRVGDRLANNRLANVVKVEGNLPNPAVPAGSVDVAITSMNFHDIYNRGGAAAGEAFMKSVYDALKPGGVFGVVDHAGNEGAENSKLHRVAKKQAIDTAKAVGFLLEAESDILANPADDRSTPVSDSNVRGKTDKFTLRLRKPKTAG
jgi:predicted methyltransferase